MTRIFFRRNMKEKVLDFFACLDFDFFYYFLRSPFKN